VHNCLHTFDLQPTGYKCNKHEPEPALMCPNSL